MGVASSCQPPRAAGAFLTRLNTLEAQATAIRLRPRQRIVLTPAQDDILYAVQSGVLLARAEMMPGDACFLSLAFPGDVIAASAVPHFTDRALVAATPVEALRFKAKALARQMCEDIELMLAYDRQRDRQLARASVHTSVLAGLDGPQRLAAFLLEMALEIGVASGPFVAIALPLSRTEIAQYLSLNADTLSRLMSRFRADGLVVQKSRHHIALRDWRAIADLCPIAAALIAVERNRANPLP